MRDMVDMLRPGGVLLITEGEGVYGANSGPLNADDENDPVRQYCLLSRSDANLNLSLFWKNFSWLFKVISTLNSVMKVELNSRSGFTERPLILPHAVQLPSQQDWNLYEGPTGPFRMGYSELPRSRGSLGS